MYEFIAPVIMIAGDISYGLISSDSGTEWRFATLLHKRWNAVSEQCVPQHALLVHLSFLKKESDYSLFIRLCSKD